MGYWVFEMTKRTTLMKTHVRSIRTLADKEKSGYFGDFPSLHSGKIRSIQKMLVDLEHDIDALERDG